MCAPTHWSSRVSGRKRTPSAAEGRREVWLGRGLLTRGRPWTLEEQLLGAVSEKTRSSVLNVLTADLADERAGLSRLDQELHEQAVRVARLEGRLNARRERGPARSAGTGP